MAKEISIIKLEHLAHGMIVAEDVYTKRNQMIVSHGMVLNQSLILLLKTHKVTRIKVCSESIGQISDYRRNMAYSNWRVESKECQAYEEIYRFMAQEYEDYLYRMLRYGEAFDTVDLIERLKELSKYVSDQVHMIEIMNNPIRKEHFLTGHSINVAVMAYLFAKELGLSEEEQDIIILSGLFHDIGRIATPSVLINRVPKSEFNRLIDITETEDKMKEHIFHGYQFLEGLGIDGRVTHTVLYHHERLDGSGYFYEEVYDEIDIYAGVIGLIDMAELAFIAHPRVALKNILMILELLQEKAPQKFHPDISEKFLQFMAGRFLYRLVRLNNGMQGEVIAHNEQGYTRPIVKTDYGYIDLEKSPHLTIIEIL